MLITKKFFIKDYLEELKVINLEHHAEVGVVGADKPLSLDADYNFFMSLEEKRMFLSYGLFTVNDRLVGYIGWLVHSSWHHLNDNFATTDCFTIKKEYRHGAKYILRMFRESEALLRNDFGVQYLQFIYSTNIDLGKLGSRLGYTPANITMLKDLGKKLLCQ